MKGESGVTEVSLINFNVPVSKEINWKVKVVLLEVSLTNLILRISNEIKWKVKLDLVEVSLQIFPWDIQGDQIEGETGVSRNIIDELHSQDIEGDQM